jgi:outer membrane protein insertion porin family
MFLSRSLAAVAALVLAVLISSPAAAAPLTVVAIEIDGEGLAPQTLEEIRSVLPLKEGEPFDPKKLDQSLSYLKKWGRFSDVNAETRAAAGGLVVRFLLRDGVIVSGIDIYATYPYLSTRIRRMITVHSGDLYDEKAALAQCEKIEGFYERQGYDETEVSVTPSFNQKKRTVDLVFRVTKGHRHRIGEITVHGNTVFREGYFNSQINPLLLYKPTRLRRSLEKIRKDYQEKGYLGARVRLSDLRKDEATHTVNPVIEVRQGRHVTVKFEGNRRVRTENLKKAMPMFTDGGYGDYEIDASAKAILDYYRRRGFQETTVDFEKAAQDADKESLLVVFRIREGPQTRVKTVTIYGNEEIPDRKVKKGLATKENTIFERGYYQPRTVAEDRDKIPLILKDRGALDAKLVDHETSLNRFHDKATVAFSVAEGPLVRLKEIRFEGNERISSMRLKRRIKLRAGDAVSASRIETDKEALTLHYTNHGFPYATVVPDVERDGNAALLTFRIHEGPETRIGNVLVVGNERTAKKAVLRVMQIRPGDKFSYAKILESESWLRRSGAFRSVNIQTIGLTEREPVVHLVVKLEEYRKILLDVGVTYDTDNSFTGELSLSHINLGGTIRRANVRLIGGRDIQKGELLFRDSFFVGYPFEATMNVFLERDLKPGFKTVEGGGALGFLREFTPRTSFLGRYEIIRTFISDVVDDTGIDEADHTTSKFSFSFNYDTRNSFADPTRGFLGFTGIDVSNKLIASTFNFIQPKGIIAHYLPLGSRSTFLSFGHVEGIKVFGDDTLTRDEKLFLGGDYSVRGFDQDALGPVGADGRPSGGQLLLAATFEFQTRLFSNFKFALFQDNGSITQDFSEIGLASMRHSAGAGLRYVTPVGPLRLDYGFKLDKKAGESIGRLHFAFGYSF